MTYDLIRLSSLSTEWRAYYRNFDKLNPTDQSLARKRMSEISSELTRLERLTGVQTRQIPLIDLFNE